MEEGRTYTIRKKVRIILDKSFPVFKELELGDKGLMSLTGIIEGARIEPQIDRTELIVQSINIINAEKIEVLNSGRI